jgi:hypothetical protein
MTVRTTEWVTELLTIRVDNEKARAVAGRSALPILLRCFLVAPPRRTAYKDVKLIGREGSIPDGSLHRSHVVFKPFR